MLDEPCFSKPQVLVASRIVRDVQREVAEIAQKTIDCMAAELADGRDIALRDFGIFAVTSRKACLGRNPKQPEKIVPIPPRTVIKFRAGRELKERVGKLPQINT